MGPYYATPMAPRKNRWINGGQFNPLCKAEFAGGNGIYFGIRSAASESIEDISAKQLLSWLVRPDRALQVSAVL